MIQSDELLEKYPMQLYMQRSLCNGIMPGRVHLQRVHGLSTKQSCFQYPGTEIDACLPLARLRQMMRPLILQTSLITGAIVPFLSLV